MGFELRPFFFFLLGQKFYGITAVCLACFLVIACKEQSEGWHHDEKFSQSLTKIQFSIPPVNPANFPVNNTLDAIEIYSVRQQKTRMYSLDKLKKMKLIYKSTDRREMLNFLSDVQQHRPEPIYGCHSNKNLDRKHVVAYDNSLKRYAYFVITTCTVEEKLYGYIQVGQKNDFALGIIFNKKIGQALNRIGIQS